MGKKLGLRLTEAIDLHLDFQQSRRQAANTYRNKRQSMDRLRRHLGGQVLVDDVTERDLNSYFATRSTGRDGVRNSTLNIDISAWNEFFGDLHSQGNIENNPMFRIKRKKEAKKIRPRIEGADFDDAIGLLSPGRDQALAAAGFFQCLRISDLVNMRVRDLHLDGPRPWWAVANLKTGDALEQPLRQEFLTYLRTWLHEYAVAIERPLQPADLVFPGRTRPDFAKNEAGMMRPVPASARYNPRGVLHKGHNIMKPMLEKMGLELRDDNDKSNREGMHTLRHSGARAFYRAMQEAQRDNALSLTQRFLGHAQITTTMHYIGHHQFQADLEDAIYSMPGKTVAPKVAGRENIIAFPTAR